MRALSLTLLATLLGIAGSCSNPPDRPEMASASVGTGEIKRDPTNPTNQQMPSTTPGPGPDGNNTAAPTENLSLGALNPGDSWKGALDLTKPLQLFWLSESDLLIANDSGKSVIYNTTAKTWSSVHQNTTAGSYPQFFDFRDGGYVAVTDEAISFKAAAGGITNVKQIEELKGVTIVAVNPSSVQYKVGNDLKVIRAADGKAALVQPKALPAGVESLYPCNTGCEFWGFDGTRIHLYIGEGIWKLDSHLIVLPAEEKVLRMAVRFSDAGGVVISDQVFVQSATGKLFILADGGTVKGNVEWTEVLTLAKHYCINCHIDDGYDKEDTWKQLKPQILAAMKAKPTDKLAMPPPETALGKEMTTAEKAKVISWMEKQQQKDRGNIGGDGDTGKTDRNAAIAGDLKKFGEPNCVNCHATANKMGFWLDMKADAATRVKSGNMPKNKTMSAADRAALVKAIEAVK